jgi:hypothetical protein
VHSSDPRDKQVSDQSDTALPSVVLKGAAFGLLAILLLLTWNAGRAGFASLLTAYAGKSSQLAPADAAVNLNASNPDAHYVRATILEASDLPAATTEYYQAALARPDDFVLWLSLARARELNGETAGAIAASRQALSNAPYYSQPHYQLGNILVRAGKKDEGFRELRQAGVSNPTLMPGIIDLAWRVSGGNPQFVKQAIKPETPEEYQALAQYFRDHQEVDAAIEMYAGAGSRAEQSRGSYLSDLVGAKRFKEAAVLWGIGHPGGVAPGTMLDPGFEEEHDLNQPGFGWRMGERPQGCRLSLDTTNPKEGHSSLKVEFNGDPDPGSPIISQLVLTEPGTRYELRFAVRSEGLISGGLPGLQVIDASADRMLGESGELPRATDGWRDYRIEFETGLSTGAIQVALQRRRCERTPCPIFGRLWLDGFSLHKL